MGSNTSMEHALLEIARCARQQANQGLAMECNYPLHVSTTPVGGPMQDTPRSTTQSSRRLLEMRARAAQADQRRAQAELELAEQCEREERLSRTNSARLREPSVEDWYQGTAEPIVQDHLPPSGSHNQPEAETPRFTPNPHDFGSRFHGLRHYNIDRDGPERLTFSPARDQEDYGVEYEGLPEVPRWPVQGVDLQTARAQYRGAC